MRHLHGRRHACGVNRHGMSYSTPNTDDFKRAPPILSSTHLHHVIIAPAPDVHVHEFLFALHQGAVYEQQLETA